MFLLKMIKVCFTPLFLKGPCHLVKYCNEAFGPLEYWKVCWCVVEHVATVSNLNSDYVELFWVELS